MSPRLRTLFYEESGPKAKLSLASVLPSFSPSDHAWITCLSYASFMYFADSTISLTVLSIRLKLLVQN